MELWQWLILFGAVSINTAVNIWRLYIEKQKLCKCGKSKCKCNDNDVPQYLSGDKKK